MLEIKDIEQFFVLKNNQYHIHENISYVNLSSIILAKFNISLSELVNFCFENYSKNKDHRLVILLFSCMQNNTFQSIDITKILYFHDFSDTLLFNVFNNFENSYIYFPLKTITNNIYLFLSISSLMLSANIKSAKHIANSGLNKILLAKGNFPVDVQNQILDLKITISCYV